LAEGRRVNQLAGNAEVHPDLSPVAERIRGEATTDWDDTIAAERFTDTGGRLIRGTARLIAPRTAPAGGQQIRARRGLTHNTGTDPAVPPIPGLAEAPYWTSRDALRATEAPASMVVLGGGPSGVELAQGFSRFGTQVQIVEAAERILAAVESPASLILTDHLEHYAFGRHTDTTVE